MVSPLIAMSFPYRHRARLGPLRFNFSSAGLSWSGEQLACSCTAELINPGR